MARKITPKKSFFSDFRGWTGFVPAMVNYWGMNAARFFQRREDYQPPQTPDDSAFRLFIVHCLKCGSFKLRVIIEHDEDSGETAIFLCCPRCTVREKLPTR